MICWTGLLYCDRQSTPVLLLLHHALCSCKIALLSVSLAPSCGETWLDPFCWWCSSLADETMFCGMLFFFDLVAVAEEEKDETTRPDFGEDKRWCTYGSCPLDPPLLFASLVAKLWWRDWSPCVSNSELAVLWFHFMWLNARIGVCEGSQCDLFLGGGIELMVLGFISLLLTVFQPVVASLCMPERLRKSMLPCAYDANANETSTCAAVQILSLMLCGCVCVCFLLVLNLIHVSFPGSHIL